MKVKNWLVRVGLLCMGLLMIQGALAESPSAPPPPHKVVEEVTASMMEIIGAGEEALKEDPEAYFRDIRRMLEANVSFPYIARNVMASYWAQADEQQRKDFVETFTRSMVETLGKGMASYQNLNIRTLEPEGDFSELRRVEVVQEIRAQDGTSRVSYTLARNRENEWKLINVVLNGVNLGMSFRDQFAQAMRQHDDNIDKVIRNWAQQS